MIGGLFYIGDAMSGDARQKVVSNVHFNDSVGIADSNGQYSSGDSRQDPFVTSKLNAYNAGRNSTGKYLSVDWNSNDY